MSADATHPLEQELLLAARPDPVPAILGSQRAGRIQLAALALAAASTTTWSLDYLKLPKGWRFLAPGWLLVAAAIVFGVVLLAAHYFLTVTAPGDLLTTAQIKAYLLRAALMGSLVAVLGVPLLSLILSHRIAGPAWRLRMAACEVAGGDFSGVIPSASMIT